MAAPRARVVRCGGQRLDILRVVGLDLARWADPLRFGRGALVVVLLAASLPACGRDPDCDRLVDSSEPGATFQPATGDDPIVAAAGDIASPGAPCPGERATADLLARIDPTIVLALGDNQYKEGTLAQFRSSYDLTWGRFLDTTRPVPGNHEYRTVGARGYFEYFGMRAGPDGRGYYSFDLGSWHLVAIDSGSGTISEGQLSWIRADLAADGHSCELAFWHHPRWTSGTVVGPDPIPDLDPLWRALFEDGVDIAVNAHAHQYERFEPLEPGGGVDETRGIREFV